MVIEPGIQVNPVKDQAPTQADAGDAQLHQQRDTDPQVHRSLFLRQAPHGGQRQVRLVHHSSGRPCLPR